MNKKNKKVVFSVKPDDKKQKKFKKQVEKVVWDIYSYQWDRGGINE